jgi:hypothetical protein
MNAKEYVLIAFGHVCQSINKPVIITEKQKTDTLQKAIEMILLVCGAAFLVSNFTP